MKKSNKLFAGFSLLLHAFTFIVMFFMLAKKKKSFAGAFLALAAAGTVAGAALIYSDRTDEAKKKKRMDDIDRAFDLSGCGEQDDKKTLKVSDLPDDTDIAVAVVTQDDDAEDTEEIVDDSGATLADSLSFDENLLDEDIDVTQEEISDIPQE